MPLTKKQVENAKLKIDELHPIKDTLLSDAFPFVGFLKKLFSCGYCKKNQAEKMVKEDDPFEQIE